jgi:hypothetical protein
MADLTDKEIEAARRRGAAARTSEPRAKTVRYDRKVDSIVIDLTSGASVTIPSHLIEGLDKAKSTDIAGVVVQSEGYGLHWPALDLDLSVPGLLAGVFGTRAFMARRAGQATSKAKAAASRRNGAKGGRPRKASAA